MDRWPSVCSRRSSVLCISTSESVVFRAGSRDQATGSTLAPLSVPSALCSTDATPPTEALASALWCSSCIALRRSFGRECSAPLSKIPSSESSTRAPRLEPLRRMRRCSATARWRMQTTVLDSARQFTSIIVNAAVLAGYKRTIECSHSSSGFILYGSPAEALELVATRSGLERAAIVIVSATNNSRPLTLLRAYHVSNCVPVKLLAHLWSDGPLWRLRNQTLTSRDKRNSICWAHTQ